MVRKILGVVLMVLGLAVAGGAIGSATIWKPAEVVTISPAQAISQPYVVTAPGVLDVVNEQVTITLSAKADTELVLVRALEPQILAWLGEDAEYTEITGLESWEALSVRNVAPQAELEPEEGEEPEEDSEPITVDPRGADLWVEEITGTGTITYSWTSEPGRWMILAATDGQESAPEIALTWEREVPTPLLIPGVIAGAFIFIVGLIMTIFTLLALREAKRSRALAEETAEADVELPQDLDTSNFTRRQVRELQTALATTGEIPVHLLELGQAGSGQHTAPTAGSPAGPDYDPLDELLVVPESLEQNSGGQDLEDWIKSAPQELSPQAGMFAQVTPPTGVQLPAPTSAQTPEQECQAPSKPRWQDIWSRWADDGKGPAADGKNSDPAQVAAATPGSVQNPESAATPASATTPVSAGSSASGAFPASVPTPPRAPSPQISGAHWRQTWRQALNQESDASAPSAERESAAEREQE